MKKIAIGRTAASLVAFLAMDTTTIALAEPPGHNPMTLMDRDKNGSVSLKELRIHRSDTTDEMFARWDADGSRSRTMLMSLCMSHRLAPATGRGSAICVAMDWP